MSTGIVRYDELPRRYRSRYLDECFPVEPLRFETVRMDLAKMEAEASVIVDPHPPLPDGPSYRWTVITAYRAGVQLGLGLAREILDTDERWENDLEELVQGSASYGWNPITGTRQQIRVWFPQFDVREHCLSGTLEYRVGNDIFGGTAQFVNPRQSTDPLRG